MLTSFSAAITLAVGATMLLVGWRIFWFYVGLIGFLVGFDLAQLYLVAHPAWLQFAVGMTIGGVFAAGAIFLQYITIAIAGFISGSYLVIILVELFQLFVTEAVLLIALVVSGLLGMLLFLRSLDIAVALISAIIGASVLVSPFLMTPILSFVIWIVLASGGVMFQLSMQANESRKSTAA